MICDSLEHLGRYRGLNANLDTAIDYLQTHDISALPDGRTEVEPYQPDIGKKDSEDAVFGALGEGRFVLFFPGELHRPGVEMPGCDRVRKAVVKIKMEDKYHG